MTSLAATLLLLAAGQSPAELKTGSPVGIPLVAPVPIHYAADARTYLLTELLRRGGEPLAAAPAVVSKSAPPWTRLLTTPAETKADRVALDLLYTRLELADVKSQVAEIDTDAAALSAAVVRLKKQLAELRAAGQRESKQLLNLQRRLLRVEVQRELSNAEQRMTPENPRLDRLRQRAKAVLPLL